MLDWCEQKHAPSAKQVLPHAPALQVLGQLLGSGLPPGVVLQGLAAQLLERSKAVVKMVKVRACCKVMFGV